MSRLAVAHSRNCTILVCSIFREIGTFNQSNLHKMLQDGSFLLKIIWSDKLNGGGEQSTLAFIAFFIFRELFTFL